MITAEEIARVFKAEYGRSVAVLARQLGDTDRAEEAVQEAFVEALRRWPAHGLPSSPAGWIVTSARRKGIDRFRRESAEARRAASAYADTLDYTQDDAEDDGNPSSAVPDERLRLIFTCCHPALAHASQVALTLRLLGGLSVAEIARAFLTPEATIGQRISRAKAKIRDTGIPYRIPARADIEIRQGAVLSVIYLIFNEGYAASSGDELIRSDLCAEAIRLARMLEVLVPDVPEVVGLLALLLLIESRHSSRTTRDGELVMLGHQDRSLWNRALIDEGHTLVRQCLRFNAPGPYQIQAAINAVHCDATEIGATDWRQILQLYDQLLAVQPTQVVALHRIVAFSEVHGAPLALPLLDAIELPNYQLLHAIRGDLLCRAGRVAEGAKALDLAIAGCGNTAERNFLRRKRQQLETRE